MVRVAAPAALEPTPHPRWHSPAERVPLDSIVVREEHPLRVGPDVIRAYATTLQVAGQLNPLTVTLDGVLLDGRIRLEAMRLLQWDRVRVCRVDAADAAALFRWYSADSIEQQPSWINRLWRLRHAQREYVAAHPQSARRGRRRIAEAASAIPCFAEVVAGAQGITARAIRQRLEVATRLTPAVFDILEQAHQSYTLAGVRRLAALEEGQQLTAATFARDQGVPLQLAIRQLTWTPEAGRELDATDSEDHQLVAGDFVDAAASLPDASVDLVLTDVPWEHDMRGRFSTMARVMEAKLRPGGTALVMVGQRWVPEMIYALQGSGLIYRWLFVYQTFNPAAPPHGRSLISGWYPVLEFRKVGEAPIIGEEINDVVWESTMVRDPAFHGQMKDIEAFERLICMFTLPGAMVYDPFIGGGTSPIAARRTGRRFFGSDINPAHVESATARMANHAWRQSLAEDGVLLTQKMEEAEAGPRPSAYQRLSTADEPGDD